MTSRARSLAPAKAARNNQACVPPRTTSRCSKPAALIDQPDAGETQPILEPGFPVRPSPFPHTGRTPVTEILVELLVRELALEMACHLPELLFGQFRKGEPAARSPTGARRQPCSAGLRNLASSLACVFLTMSSVSHSTACVGGSCPWIELVPPFVRKARVSRCRISGVGAEVPDGRCVLVAVSRPRRRRTASSATDRRTASDTPPTRAVATRA